MKLEWLGQAGWLVTTNAGTVVMIDPYLSDSLEETKGPAFHRQVEIRPEYLSIQIDVVVITHNHADHLDMQTLRTLFEHQKKPVTVLGPRSVWEILRAENPWKNELVLFGAGTRYTIKDVCFHAVFAAHSDPAGIGVVIETEGKRIYHTGDTLYHTGLFQPLTQKPDVLLLPINGKGNNMNIQDALDLARALEPGVTIPMHWDMFAAMGCDPVPFAEALAGCGRKAEILSEYEAMEL